MSAITSHHQLFSSCSQTLEHSFLVLLPVKTDHGEQLFLRKKLNSIRIFRLGYWLSDYLVGLFSKLLLPAGMVDRANSLTCWYRKNVLMVMQLNPMWRNTAKTLVTDPPETNTANARRKFPAAICVPDIFGWLFHTFTLLGHLGLWQVVVTTAIVPSWRTSTSGLSVLQKRQNWNRRSKLDRKTTCMCLGCERRFWLSSVIFKLKPK